MHFQSDSNASNASPEKSQFPEAAQTVEFPEGGLSGWSTVAGASVFFFLFQLVFHLLILRFLVQFCGFGYDGNVLFTTADGV